MPVTLAQSLPQIAFSKNAIVLKLLSSDYVATSPANSVNYLEFTAAVAVDAQAGMAWNAGSAAFTAKASPDNSGNQFPSGAGDSAYVTSLQPYFQSNYFIDQAYIVSVDTSGAHPRLIFTARAQSADYDFTAATNQGIITHGTTGAPKPNFMHHVEVWISNLAGTDYVKAYDANIALDEPKTGTTTLDISESLHSFLTLDIPSLTAGTWQACPGSCRRYYVKYAQYYGDIPSVQRVYTTPVLTVVYGGYSNIALQQITDRINYLSKYLLPDPSLYQYQRWLETWPIENVDVKTNQPQFLYFINNRSVTDTLAIKTDLVFDDASTQTVYVAGGSIASFAKVAVGCGYQQLGLQAYTTSLKKVSSYTITLVDATTHDLRSKPKTFTIDRNYEDYTRHFLYSDSAGNFKTLHTYGRSALTSDAEFDLTAFQPDVATLPSVGNYRNNNIKAVQNDQVNTGYVSTRSSYDAIVELQLSKMIFRVFGTKMTPVVTTTKQFAFSADGNNLKSAVIEYRLAYDEDLYTADSASLAIPALNQSQQAINDL